MMYLHNDKQIFEEVVSATANEIRFPIAIIEKDYYPCCLRLLKIGFMKVTMKILPAIFKKQRLNMMRQ